MTEETEVAVLKPGTDEHAAAEFSIDTAVNHQSKKFDYNKLALAYNGAPVGSVLVLGNSNHLQTSNVVTILVARGLISKRDFNLNKAIRDVNGKRLAKEDRNLLMKKLTAKPLQEKD